MVSASRYVDIGSPDLGAYEVELTKRVNGDRYILLDRNTSAISKIIVERDIDSPTIDFTFHTLRMEQEVIENGDIIDITGPVVDSSGNVTKEKLWTCYVFEYNNDYWSRDTITARNMGHWVENSSFYMKILSGETASDFVKRTADQYKIPIDHIEDTEYILEPHMFEKTTLYNAWLRVYGRTGVEEEKIFQIYFSIRGLVIENINQETRTSFPWYEVTPPLSNIIAPNRTVSIKDKDFVNVARGGRFSPLSDSYDISEGVDDNEAGYDVIKENPSSLQRFGEFFRDVDISNFGTEEERDKYLQEMVDKGGEPIEKVTFESYIYNNSKPGDRIYIFSPQIKSYGEYFIQNLRSTISPGFYRDEIEASKLRNIPVELYTVQGYNLSYDISETPQDN